MIDSIIMNRTPNVFRVYFWTIRIHAPEAIQKLTMIALLQTFFEGANRVRHTDGFKNSNGKMVSIADEIVLTENYRKKK